MDSKAECDQFNLAQVARKQGKWYKTETKTNICQCQGSRSVKAVQKEPERLWRKGFVKEMRFKSGVKDRGSDRMLS